MSLKAEDETRGEKEKDKRHFSSRGARDSFSKNNSPIAGAVASVGVGAPSPTQNISNTTDFADTPRKQLSSMIREGLKRRSISSITVDSDEYDSDKEAPFNPEYSADKKRLKEEIASLHGDYSAYIFETIGFSISPESGGIAHKLKIEMQLPSISQERQLNNAKKHEELAKSNNITVSALPKDTVDHSPEILRNIYTPSTNTGTHPIAGSMTSNSNIFNNNSSTGNSYETSDDQADPLRSISPPKKSVTILKQKKAVLQRLASNPNM
jgi:hypothetical protein